MVSIIQTCRVSGKSFTITDEDQAFYKQLGVPLPTLSPEERNRRRLTWRNERSLYLRQCDGTGKQILSVYDKDSPFPVFEPDYWYSDAWNAKDYGRDFDFTRPFFEQFIDLMNEVPQLALSVTGNENCDYINQAGWNKNCYLIYEANYSENCYYSIYIQSCRDCMDSTRLYECELCYECINCEHCYNLKFSEDSTGCSDSWFLKNCIGCKNCFGCVNLRNKEYHFFNEPCTPEEYQRKLAEYGFDQKRGIKRSQLQAMKEQVYAFQMKFPHKYMHSRQTENCTGDYISNSQNCFSCFGIWNCQDCKYVVDSRNMKNVHDVTVFGAANGAEWCYETHEVGDGCRNIVFSDQIWSGCYDILYSRLCCQNCHHLFGCVGMKHANYCILNKQYTKEDYEALVPKIIEHMKKTGEWGEFFPASLSPWGYNETRAIDYFPLEESEARQAGFNWKQRHIPKFKGEAQDPPETIAEVDEDILQSILCCKETGRSYKIIASELAFYRKFGLPLPTTHPDQRHKKRMARTLPRFLWKRHCQECATEIETAFSPKRPEKVLCEKCYLNTVY